MRNRDRLRAIVRRGGEGRSGPPDEAVRGGARHALGAADRRRLAEARARLTGRESRREEAGQ